MEKDASMDYVANREVGSANIHNDLAYVAGRRALDLSVVVAILGRIIATGCS